jgi:hypothetical protein
MDSERPATRVAHIDLEFDTSTAGGAPLGDIASSLVSVDELLRDLATIAAYPGSVEFREIRVAAIETRSPLKVKLSLIAIPEGAVAAFQRICRDVIAKRPADIDAALKLCAPDELPRLTQHEAQRLRDHVATLANAKVRLKAVRSSEH